MDLLAKETASAGPHLWADSSLPNALQRLSRHETTNHGLQCGPRADLRKRRGTAALQNASVARGLRFDKGRVRKDYIKNPPDCQKARSRHPHAFCSRCCLMKIVLLIVLTAFGFAAES